MLLSTTNQQRKYACMIGLPFTYLLGTAEDKVQPDNK
jgi:hypothetical protein